ncbi:MAG: 4Fe-4S dicluster domain-containing protein [Nanoarchaeota archaeon]
MHAINFESFGKFVNELAESADVFGPVKGKVTSFEKIKDASELNFDVLTEYGAKGILLKPGELMYSYKNDMIIAPELLTAKQKNKVLLGLRMCDLAAIKKHDIVFKKQAPEDPYYAKRRDNTLLFGYHQKQCGDEWCFCQSIDLDVSFDLMFYKRSDHYLVEIGSEEGKKVIDKFKKYFDESDYVMTADDKRIDNQIKLDEKDISKIYENHEWQKLSDACISCGACNVLCPTCYCFEFRDNIKPDGTFEKTREFSECQLSSFTKVAGGHKFRDKKLDKFKHRIYHQLQYFKEKTGKTLCVGCGRCIRHCPERIDFVSGINKMNAEVKQ